MSFSSLISRGVGTIQNCITSIPRTVVQYCTVLFVYFERPWYTWYNIGFFPFLEGPFWGGSRVTLTIFQFWFRVMLCMGLGQTIPVWLLRKCTEAGSTFSVFTDLYKLVNGLRNVEKYGFYLFQSMLEINEIWSIIQIYNILSASNLLPSGPGVKLSPNQTFLSELLDLKFP